MARQYVTITVEVDGREYKASGDYTARQGDSRLKAIERALDAIRKTFPEVVGKDINLAEIGVVDATYPIQPLKVPTAEEHAATRRSSLVWCLLRLAREEDPLKLIADYAAKVESNTGYANVANALAWRAEDAMKHDVKRAWAVSILDDLNERGAFTANWRVFDDQQKPENWITDPVAFDEVIDYFKKVALKRALEGVANQSTSPAHNMLARIEHDVAAELYGWLTGTGSSWF